MNLLKRRWAFLPDPSCRLPNGQRVGPNQLMGSADTPGDALALAKQRIVGPVNGQLVAFDATWRVTVVDGDCCLDKSSMSGLG